MSIQYRKILELHAQKVVQRNIAAATGNSRPKIAEIIKRAKEEVLVPPFTDEMDDEWFEALLFPHKKRESKGRQLPDFEHIHTELAKSNVTLSLLHYEYEAMCRQNNVIPYAYRTFCQYYHEYAQKYKATMRIKRKPGETMEVDWAGTTLSLTDSDTGEIVKAYLFVATLPCSQYGYCEARLSMKQEDWLVSHIHAYKYFGGVTEILVPDNLKTGVTRHQAGEAVLNSTYRELASHYNTIILPTRVRTPKDKANVEGSVKILSTWIIAALRNEKFFTLIELNQAVREKLDEFNLRPFTKKYKKGNRKDAFISEEQFALQPLPRVPYKMATWKTATVQLDYHTNVENMFYSVPYEYIQNKVDIKVTKDLVEIFYKDSRIASHKRLYGKLGQFSTNHDHLPENHQLYLDYTPKEAIKWAESIGEATTEVVRYLLKSAKVEKQALQATLRLKNFGRKYSSEAIEQACQDIIKIASAPTVPVIERLLRSNQQQEQPHNASAQNTYGFTRGAAYFGIEGEKDNDIR
ncbi:IS21 family transposase [Loigolactobacillus coryniformis]|uniref:IS21 family transposase n=1 Tax=Loigolactobacillus coryniformis TaxID=1610 RepID=UPI00345CF823